MQTLIIKNANYNYAEIPFFTKIQRFVNTLHWKGSEKIILYDANESVDWNNF